jgi:hypothetical protein
MGELAVEKISGLYLPLSRGRAGLNFSITGLGRSFGDALKIYRQAVSMTYLTATNIPFGKQGECKRYAPDDDCEGRDPSW